MPLVQAADPRRPLGFLLPPMPEGPAASPGVSTSGATIHPTFGSTDWLLEACAGAEQSGAGAVWATDHLFWRQPTLECTTAVAVAATATRRAAVGTCVLQLPLRTPAVVAKQASALQQLSGGRFVLGVGVGSHRDEYELVGADFASRGRRLDEAIGVLRSTWSNHGTHDGYRQEPAVPAPVWIGGSTRAARRRAALLGDGWIPMFVSPGRYAEDVVQLADEAVAAGRHPDAVQPAVLLVAAVGANRSEATASGLAWLSRLYDIPGKAFGRHLVAGTAEQCAEVAESYLGAGATHVAVMIAGDDALAQFAALAEALGERPAPGAEQVDRVPAIAGGRP